MVRSATALLAVLILSGFAAVQQVATHTVVDGDTLWDLASQYYDNPFEWRRIWEANRSEVADPNLILPGQVLNIPGAEATVSEVTVEGPPSQARPAAPAAPPARSGVNERTVFQQDTSRMRAGVIRSEEIQYFAVSRDLVYSVPWLVGLAEEPAHIGVLTSFATTRTLSVTPRGYERVRLTFSGERPRVGTQLQIFRVSATMEKIGDVVQPTGIVTISDLDDEGAVGIITKEYGLIALGDFLGPLPTYALTLGQKAADVSGGPEAMIVGFPGLAELQDVGAIAFLDQGADDGVAIGDEFIVFNARIGADGEEGRLQVVGVTPSLSAARIVSMDDALFHQGLVVRMVRKMR